MKATPLFIPLPAVFAIPLRFHQPAPALGAHDRGQVARKTDAAPRIAPAIGNVAYAEGPPANPVNDARDMSATPRQLAFNIVAPDACHNNQFARSFRSPSRGLAGIVAPAWTLIAYAAAPGRTASDGGGRNGLYAKELTTAARLPGLILEDVFKRARSEVRRQSNNQQISWEASAFESDFYFSTSSGRPESTTISIPAPTTLTPLIARRRGVDPSLKSEISCSDSFSTAV